VTTVYGIGGLKAALEMVGYIGGTVRAPLPFPNEQAHQEIARVLKDAKTILQQQEKDQRSNPHSIAPIARLTTDDESSLVQEAPPA
jgi:hypothetical protein